MSFFSNYLNKFLATVSTDIAIDLGTANTLVYVKGKGIVLNEPTIVAINKKTGQLVAVGQEAKTMQGRTPQHIEVVRPLVDGVISDFEVTEEMLGYLINKVHADMRTFIAPRILVGVPSGITNVEMRAARDAAKNAGAREVFLIEEPMAAAIGAKLPIGKAVGNMIIDIGGGTTDIAVISLSGIVVAKNLRVAGDHLNASITSYVRDQFKIYVGEKTAEEAKIALAAVEQEGNANEMVIRGRDVMTGLPREVIITARDIHDAIANQIEVIVEATRAVLEKTPPEVLADIMQRGIHVSGGGALIPGLASFLEEALQVPVIVVPDPLRAVVRGAGIVIENLDLYEEVLIDNEGELSPQLT
ncbi:rod shape-determining protein [Candidatus Kaiserbacteria bacterium RIFCSPLOWO2_02_FULL_45_11b]|uniref:Cell shape-determining protein MreB n=1 Tax=Candidatus Kaiserbacteria bacterium RIFCSPLOWO2_12_FULL_45_26 TaxID=1798525 RepID=A0A1F6FH66_9BACT|nr:MAG: rod shape-determining protein [Candidatus Kaiserbacteria bacterium RIFCSPHIGHO2_12_45_16]OGG70840.1 MAG: rod shape-determining protein [Candidatus Kaiserbacteria bacterium RIFCSPLOWO2_01_FULL_45_25]OGG83707.1 MAG: rod shape-determining protein [Candidatus Kaiserbacteria bacterium RIFCSPLOWO2_02_FULL_45_11b]OGG85201.1 MAG: rod shape-determining protein [Candidatus Kaiserbacteria bacterium RIFCSPLOWO2_12_FULL_45_26]